MKIKLFFKPIIWLVLICYGLFIPASNLPTKPFLSIPHFDKMVHFGLFFVFCLLLFRPLKILKQKPYFYAPAISVLLAAILEIAQQVLSTSRSSNLYDFFANTLGIVASIIIFRLLIDGKKWEKLL